MSELLKYTQYLKFCKKKKNKKLEEFVQRVKELTEEREKLSRDFKDENDELKRKIRALENEVEYLTEELDQRSAAASAAAADTPTSNAKSSLNRLKSDASSDG